MDTTAAWKRFKGLKDSCAYACEVKFWSRSSVQSLYSIRIRLSPNTSRGSIHRYTIFLVLIADSNNAQTRGRRSLNKDILCHGKIVSRLICYLI